MERKISTNHIFEDSSEFVLTRPSPPTHVYGGQMEDRRIKRLSRDEAYVKHTAPSAPPPQQKRSQVNQNDLFADSNEQSDESSEDEVATGPGSLRTKMSESQERLVAESVKDHLMGLREQTKRDGSLKSYNAKSSLDPYMEKYQKGAASSSTAVGIYSCCLLM